MQTVKILPATLTAAPFDYTVPPEMHGLLQVGSLVQVPLGRRQVLGCVWALEGSGDVSPEKLKPVARLYDAVPALSEKQMRFIDWMADYTLQSRGMILKMVLSSPAALEGEVSGRVRIPDIVPSQITPATLSAQQQAAAAQLVAQVDAARFSVALLDGVTGSGKTEVYFAAIEAALKAGTQVLVLLPEINLSVQWLERFTTRFGVPPHVWHSDVTPARKRTTWRAIATAEEGVGQLVVGARSALFLPFSHLGLVVVDEEHEPAFKQEEGVLYHARDMAVVRAKFEDVPIVLASATPSLETLANVAAGKYAHVHLPSRYGVADLPEVTLVDMRAHGLPSTQWLSPPLVEALEQVLEKGEQAALFLNRRGYAPLTLCRACGHRLHCPHCASYLVLHGSGQAREHLRCHHCGWQQKIPKACPDCEAEDKFAACGPGVERIAEAVAAKLPSARIGMMTSDHISSAAQADAFIAEVGAGKLDIIIGTQMIAKGHHFPQLTLIGVVDADFSLGGGDFRAGERTYQLLHQVAGRAGRAEKPGSVLLQSYMPEHPALQALKRHDRDGFFALEQRARELSGMPPYGRLAAIIVSAKKEAMLQDACRQLAAAFPHYKNVQLLGPAPALLYRLRMSYRMRFLLKAGREVSLQHAISDWLARVKLPSAVSVRVDIDPVGFM